ncbi:thioesterase family protein [Kineosporia sp. A_224]|uniref:thioesterase family protein n=1 Tax=Kineosporia sp. A_224 TaxID=1962180 RepID=UPI000B4BDC3A|nr:thioesterase family protein [Kineosporia sp. A_224]MBI4940364.1 thioesterase family protein [Actinomycetota bacterium]
MLESLQAGITGDATITVTPEMSPPHLPEKVLSTPTMVRLIEETCLESVQPHLDANETSVGTHVNFSHSAKVVAGEAVRIVTEVTEVDRRRIEFVTRVTCGDRVVSEGTHQRFVVRY